MNTKTLKTVLGALLLAGATAYGGVYRYNSAPNATILDGNPGGIQDSINVSGALPVISDVKVYLNVTGGHNGDLYAYVNLGGTSVILLNRIGSSSGNPFGSASAGLGDNSSHTYQNDSTWYSFKLDDSGTSGLHDYTGTTGVPVTGSYKPDSAGSTSFGSFTGANPNGTWSIFFADMASGGGSTPSTLVGWGLEITAVPEPVNVALGIFGGVALVVFVVRSRRVRARIQCWRAAFIHWVNAV
jgi:hypothetical protein